MAGGQVHIIARSLVFMRALHQINCCAMMATATTFTVMKVIALFLKHATTYPSFATLKYEKEAGDHAGSGGGSDEKRGATNVSACSCSGGTSDGGTK